MAFPCLRYLSPCPIFATFVAPVVLLGISAPSAVAQTPPPGVTRALDSLLDTAGSPESVEACSKIRSQFSDFVDKHKLAPWDELAPPESLDTAKKLSTKIEQLSDGRTIDEFVRHIGEFLLRYPQHAEYPKRLWELAALTSGLELQGTPSPLFGKPVAEQLFEWCELLPADDPYRLEAGLLAARHFHARGNYEAEETKLQALLGFEGLPQPVRVATRSLLGVCLEAQGRIDDALALYAQAEDGLELFPAASDTTFRAALIHALAGRRDRATALLEKLSEVDPALRKLARASKDIDALLTLLEEPGALSRYWDHGDEWWPAWVELRNELGYEQPVDELRLPDLPTVHGLGPALGAAIARGDRDEFHRQLDMVMQALRLCPSVIGEAGAALCFLAPQLNPEQSDAIYAVVIEICSDFATPDRDLSRSAQLYLTVALSDGGRPKEALEVIARFRENDPEPDELSETMTRLWAHLSLAEGADLEAPKKALEELLESGERIQSRAQTVLYLAQILDRLGLAEEELAMLERELDDPALRADEAIAAGLEARRRVLDSGRDGGDFAQAVEEWKQEHAPAWLPFALPLGLADPRIKDTPVDELLDQQTLARAGIGAEERVQIELAVAASGEVGLAERDRAFRSAFAVLYVTEPRHSQARKMLRAVLRDDRFPEPLRQMVLIFSLDQALALGRKSDITSVLTHPLFERDNPRLAAAAQAYGRYGSTDLDSTDSLLDCYTGFLTDDRIDPSELTVIAQIFERLLSLGATDLAQTVLDDVKGWPLDPAAGQSKANLRLAFLRALKLAKSTTPFAKAMRAHLERIVGEQAPDLPRKLLDYRDDTDLKRFPERTCYDLLVWRALSSPVLQSAPDFWISLAEYMPRDEKQVAFSFALVRELLSSDIPDLEKSFAVFSTPSLIDTDDNQLLERVLKLFDEFRDPDAQPFTHAAMRVVEVQSRDLRQGKDVDLEKEWGNLDHPSLSRILLPNQLRNLMARRELAELKGVLEVLPADQLVSPDVISTTWPALEMAGMDDEAALAGESMLETIPRALAVAARTLNLGFVSDVYETAGRLNKPDLVPDGWFEYLDSQILSERDRYSLRIMRGEFAEDWGAVAEAAGSAVEEFPTYYNYYRPRGIALYHLGKLKEASDALEVYTKYSRDEVEWHEAKQLLEQIRKSLSSPGGDPGA